MPAILRIIRTAKLCLQPEPEPLNENKMAIEFLYKHNLRIKAECAVKLDRNCAFLLHFPILYDQLRRLRWDDRRFYFRLGYMATVRPSSVTLNPVCTGGLAVRSTGTTIRTINIDLTYKSSD